MTQRILVRGELSNWVHAGRILGAAALVVGIILGVAVAPWGWHVAFGGGALWLGLEVAAWKVRRIRTWLTLHADGIEVEDRQGHQAIHDSQVAAVALETKKNLNNGELASVTRKFSLWAEDQSEPIRMENKIKLGNADPLAGLIERLLDRLRKRMEETIARGGTAAGDGWHLSRTVLSLGRPPSDQQLPLSEITAVETFDGQMCVWQRGTDTAVAKLPLSGRNVHLLPALVQPYLPHTPETGAAAESALGLGRVLFERRSNRSTILVLGILSLGMIAVAAALLVAGEGAFIAGTIMLPVGVLMGLLGIWLAFTAFRCHERGVWKSTLFGKQTLRYADVGSFQYSAVRHYHNGAYTGTQLLLRFKPTTPDRGPAIKYSTRTKGDDDDLDGLRDFVSRNIGLRMAEQVRAGQTVPWTSNLKFTPDGISYRPSGLLGRKEPQLLTYAEYGGYDLKAGVFHLFARGNKKAIVTEQAAAENFYPGFFLLVMLLHEPVTEPAAAQ